MLTTVVEGHFYIYINTTENQQKEKPTTNQNTRKIFMSLPTFLFFHTYIFFLYIFSFYSICKKSEQLRNLLTKTISVLSQSIFISVVLEIYSRKY